MSRRRLARVVVPTLAVALTAAAVVPAVAQQGQAPNRATLQTKGGPKVKINRSFSDTVRFGKDVTDIRSGGTVVLRDRTRVEHTLSVVRRGQLPRNVRQVNACFEGQPCARFITAHEANPETGDVGRPLVNVGAAGFDRPGDSVFLPPRGRVNLDITAARGTNLWFMCIVHPWMQGRFRVR